MAVQQVEAGSHHRQISKTEAEQKQQLIWYYQISSNIIGIINFNIIITDDEFFPDFIAPLGGHTPLGFAYIA